MGSCFSSSSSRSTTSPSTAKVIFVDGSLMEYACAVKVHEVLAGDHHCFICSSDELFFDSKIPALGSQEALQLGQLYFMLPASKLGHRLSGADMAALAAKASSALDDAAAAMGRKKDHRRSMIQVMPVADSLDMQADVEIINGITRLPYMMSSSDMHEKKTTMRLDRNYSTATAAFRSKLGQRHKVRDKVLLSTIEELAE